MGFGERWCSWILTCGELDFDLYLHSQFSILDLDLIFLEADFFFFVKFEGIEIRRSPMLFLIMMEVFSRMLKRGEGAGLISGFKAHGRKGNGVCVSHLLFANDTILFCDANVEQILHIWMLLLCFQAVTSLKVNVCKSETIPIGAGDNVHVLVGILGCRVRNLPMSYLCMPHGASHKCSIWNPILKKIER